MLTVNGICKSFDQKLVLDHISFSCEDTGVTAIMGASGIGKTTLLNIIAGLEQADAGVIDSTFTKMSYKFQEPRLFEWLTALDNVKVVLPKNQDAEPIARDLLARVGLSDSLCKYPSELSGGMQQRVSLARSLAHGGDLLLLDEPFSAVDSETREVLTALITDYAKTHAVILVTHSLEEVQALQANLITLN